MRCRYCFSHYENDLTDYAKPLREIEQLSLINNLFAAGFRKISFAGGEPTLCNHLPSLIKSAKRIGFTTMLVTNSSRVNSALLDSISGHLDWLCLSVDSLNPATNRTIGRYLPNGFVACKEHYNNVIRLAPDYDLRIKINTVVSKYNLYEDFTNFISLAMPERWKVFQVLPIEGQNVSLFENYRISDEEMSYFLLRHSKLKAFCKIIPEWNNDMKGSYVMVNPSGRFYCNSNGRHVYSDPILEIGVHIAFNQMSYDYNKYISRNGVYNW